jgi:hypothetical protein
MRVLFGKDNFRSVNTLLFLRLVRNGTAYKCRVNPKYALGERERDHWSIVGPKGAPLTTRSVVNEARALLTGVTGSAFGCAKLKWVVHRARLELEARVATFYDANPLLGDGSIPNVVLKTRAADAVPGAMRSVEGLNAIGEAITNGCLGANRGLLRELDFLSFVEVGPPQSQVQSDRFRQTMFVGGLFARRVARQLGATWTGVPYADFWDIVEWVHTTQLRCCLADGTKPAMIIFAPDETSIYDNRGMPSEPAGLYDQAKDVQIVAALTYIPFIMECMRTRRIVPVFVEPLLRPFVDMSAAGPKSDLIHALYRDVLATFAGPQACNALLVTMRQEALLSDIEESRDFFGGPDQPLLQRLTGLGSRPIEVLRAFQQVIDSSRADKYWSRAVQVTLYNAPLGPRDNPLVHPGRFRILRAIQWF